MVTRSFKIVSGVVPVLLVLGGSVLAQNAPAPAPAAPAPAAAAPAAAAPAAAPAPLPVTAATVSYNIGRAPTAAELAASSITIYPDGRGLPMGSGNATAGAQLFADNCAVCHGKGAVGGVSAAPNLQATKGPDVDAWNRGAGQDGIPTKAPFATIVYDFIHRGMPLGNEGTLTADQYYSLTAYILAINQIIPMDMVLNQDNLAKVKMPMSPTPVIVAGAGSPAPAAFLNAQANTWFQAAPWQPPVPGYQRLPGYPY
jgi:mono/diheme cytochrome c family protein